VNVATREDRYPEDEIDLRAYIQVLIKHWWFVVGAAGLAAVISAAIGSRVPPVYEATAGVVITQSRAELSLEPKYKTTEGELGIDRRTALGALVQNAAIASEVIDRLGDRLPPEMHDVAWLMGMVKGDVGKSDFVQIKVSSSSPVRAAMVANAWGAEYEKYVNQLYSGEATASAHTIAQQAEQTKADYEAAQQDLVEFTAQNRVAEIKRLIEGKQQIIEGLQNGRQEAVGRIINETLDARKKIISAYVDAQTQNRLLAFNKEQEAKRALIGGLIDAETAARLTALAKDREARTKIFGQYVDAGIANRLAALKQEQEAKSKVFAAYADADPSAKVAVFQNQLDAKLNTLTGYYETKLKLESLLRDAEGLQAQAQQAGEPGSATNGLAILLLKAEAFASSADLPEGFQLQLGNVGDLDVGADAQIADLQALISVLETRIDDLDADIAEQSKDLFDNQGYDLMTSEHPKDDPLLAALAQRYAELFEVGDLAQDASGVWEGSDLAEAIQVKYDELFGLGPLAQSSSTISSTNPIFTAIKSQYPELFAIGDLSDLSWEVPLENPLASISTQMNKELLQLKDLETLPSDARTAEQLNQALDALDEEVRTLRSQLEAEQAKQRELARARDVAWEAYTTVARKAAEVNVASSMTPALVRFASPAVEPTRPVPSAARKNALLAGAAALMLAGTIVLFLNYMYPGFDPMALLHRRRTSAS